MRALFLLLLLVGSIGASELTRKEYQKQLQEAQLEDGMVRLKIGELKMLAQKKRASNDSIKQLSEDLYLTMLDTLHETHASNYAYTLKLQKTLDRVIALSRMYALDSKSWEVELQLDKEDYEMLLSRPLAKLPRHQVILGKISQALYQSEQDLKNSNQNLSPTPVPSSSVNTSSAPNTPKIAPNSNSKISSASKNKNNSPTQPSITPPIKINSLIRQDQVDTLASPGIENHSPQISKEAQSPPLQNSTTYTVKEMQSLWNISSLPEVYNTPYRWADIYFANKDKISNPDAIAKGMVLTIPR